MNFRRTPSWVRIWASSQRRISRLIIERWQYVIAAWLVLVIGLRWIAPSWTDIAADGDLSFLPQDAPSSIGRKMIEEAFPGSQSRSQMLIVFSRAEEKLSAADLALGLDVARRLHWYAARNAYQHLDLNQIPADDRTGNTVNSLDAQSVEQTKGQVLTSTLAESLQDNLEQLIQIEDDLAQFVESGDHPDRFVRQVEARDLLAELCRKQGDHANADIQLDTARIIREQQLPRLNNSDQPWSQAILDVYTWRNRVLGHKLDAKGRARLIAVQLDTEFMATANIKIMESIESLLVELKAIHRERISNDLQIEITGSAAVGADVLRASASGVKKTEIVTVILVLAILIAVYRSPLLVSIPILSIIVSLSVATSVVALLARDPADPESWGLGVFTTTRIFIVVLLFGAGTDFCLFLLARSQELIRLKRPESQQRLLRVLSQSWRSVYMALIVSAATTVVGLSLMWFSRFEKFQFSGPVIAICLTVTVLVCLTLTPAILSGFGKAAFWPQSLSIASDLNWSSRLWQSIARLVACRPFAILVSSLLLLLLPAVYGLKKQSEVTYDFTAELSSNSPSRRGERLVQGYFATNHGSPVSIIVTRRTPFASEDQLRKDCTELATQLYVEGVVSVRGLTDPLGDYPPGKTMGVSEKDSWRRIVLTNHRITRQLYVSHVADLSRRIAKFDVVLETSPFAQETAATLQRIQQTLQSVANNPDSDWFGAKAAISGTAIGIVDLRQVTQSDQTRIQLLVTVGVWLVLVVLLRQWILPIFLMLSVLISYFATLGVTHWVFGSIYATDFHGLDWKVPLFLFVILVAVGQDYNVYLVTRIFEEQRDFPGSVGVQRALAMTGGIITSCGAIMAGTFVAMTSPAISLWLSAKFPEWFVDDVPVLRGITELGFALSFGILLDTMLVRSLVVPAFVVLWQKWIRKSP